MRVHKLAVVVYLAGEVRVIFVRRLEDNLGRQVSGGNTNTTLGDSRTAVDSYLGAVGELVRGQVHLAKGAFSNQATEGIVADGPELVGRELAARGQPLRVEADRKRRDGTHSNSCWYELASWAWRRALARLVVSRALLLVVVVAAPTFALRPCGSAFPFAGCIPPRGPPGAGGRARALLGDRQWRRTVPGINVRARRRLSLAIPTVPGARGRARWCDVAAASLLLQGRTVPVACVVTTGPSGQAIRLSLEARLGMRTRCRKKPRVLPNWPSWKPYVVAGGGRERMKGKEGSSR